MTLYHYITISIYLSLYKSSVAILAQGTCDSEAMWQMCKGKGSGKASAASAHFHGPTRLPESLLSAPQSAPARQGPDGRSPAGYLQPHQHPAGAPVHRAAFAGREPVEGLHIRSSGCGYPAGAPVHRAAFAGLEQVEGLHIRSSGCGYPAGAPVHRTAGAGLEPVEGPHGRSYPAFAGREPVEGPHGRSYPAFAGREPVEGPYGRSYPAFAGREPVEGLHIRSSGPGHQHPAGLADQRLQALALVTTLEEEYEKLQLVVGRQALMIDHLKRALELSNDREPAAEIGHYFGEVTIFSIKGFGFIACEELQGAQILVRGFHVPVGLKAGDRVRFTAFTDERGLISAKDVVIVQ